MCLKRRHDTVTIVYDVLNYNFEIQNASMTFITENANGIHKSLCSGWIENLSTYCPAGYFYNYSIGLGCTYSNFCEEPVCGYYQLIGSIKNGITTGTVYSDSIMTVLSAVSEIAKSDNNIASIFPNPASSDQFWLEVDENIYDNIEIVFYNINGQISWQKTYQNIANIINIGDVFQCDAGFYIIKIRSGNREQYLKWQRL